MDKKKIGIITYHCVCNFGAQLQAISTVGFLKRKGYDPVVINWYPKDLDEMYQKRILKEQYDCHADFTEKSMPLTKRCQTEEELLEVIDENDLDAIILGSDALFKYMPISERKIFSKRKLQFVDVSTSDRILEGNPFWGNFIPKLKKQIPVVVFSVSSQNAFYNKANKQEYEKLKKSLERFNYITVRDEWTKQMVQYFLGNVEIPITPDPVFSFNQNTYLAVLNKEDLLEKYNLPERYVLLSFGHNYMKNDYIKTIEKELESKGYSAVAFPMPEGLKNDYGLKNKITTPLSPLDWYYLIKYASGYIGERMHPIVVALHNVVPFFCFDEYGIEKTVIPFFYKKYNQKSSKIYHILSQADLLDNMTSYKMDLRKFSSKEIVDRFLSFNVKKAEAFSSSFQSYYEKSMNTLIEQMN